MTNWRWWICILLFFSTTVNYLDRQVLSLTWKDYIAPDFHWTDADYGTITGFFSLFYAFACLFAGRIYDHILFLRSGIYHSLVYYEDSCP